ncbi:uncharacterized protein LOC142324672 [Lycorma delicatula]|uniref:uncharacterized protein LOC142324672 n=1 Tax=Lycorma delicatula TaxID=130591 RepID=UPI003F51918B
MCELAHGDLPPNYDDVVERAPTYSSLFLVSESGEVRLLNESGPAAVIVPRRPHLEMAPRYSSLFTVADNGEICEKNDDSDRQIHKEQRLKQNEEHQALQQPEEEEQKHEQ